MEIFQSIYDYLVSVFGESPIKNFIKFFIPNCLFLILIPKMLFNGSAQELLRGRWMVVNSFLGVFIFMIIYVSGSVPNFPWLRAITYGSMGGVLFSIFFIILKNWEKTKNFFKAFWGGK